MNAREALLARIRTATGGEAGDAPERLAARPEGPRPVRAADDPVERFATEARAAGSTVSGPVPPEDVPAEIAEWLAAENLPARLAASPDLSLDRFPWSSRPLLTLERRRAEPEDRVSLTPCFAGVAETGTLAMFSGPERPVTLNFLPEAHIALVSARDLVGAYEDLWARMRAAGGTPRAVNLITGPSRSADIGQELRLGAHGPRRLHIVLVDDERVEGVDDERVEGVDDGPPEGSDVR